MIRFLFLFGFFVFKNSLAQDTIPRYWIGFNDKSNTIYDLSSPNDFLSQRAIQRRLNQGIELDSTDLPVPLIYIDSVINSGNIELWVTSKWFNGIIIKTDDTLALDSILNYGFIEHLSQVKSQKVNKVRKFDLKDEKNSINVSVNPYFPYGFCFQQLRLHNADQLQDLGFKGNNIHIAVLDAGFQMADQTNGLSHLYEEGRVLSTYDFVRKETSVYEDHYHGEAVLSIIAGKREGEYWGSAPMASFHLLISEDVFSESLVEEYYWVAAAEYADSAGVDIINTSLGYTVFDDSTQNHTYGDMDGKTTPIARGSNIASSKGILCVTSAGNSGNSAWQYISSPGDADSILTVGAVNSSGDRAVFSSKGPSSDGDVKPNVMSVGWDTYFIPPSSSEVITGNGTSFSAPMMTGMVACLWEAFPELTNMELIHLIEQSSHLYLTPDSLMGYGIPDMLKIYNEVSGVTPEGLNESIIEHIYPNPFIDDFYVLFRSNIDQEINVLIDDQLGKRVFETNAQVYKGVNQIHLNDISGIKSGCYFITIGSSLGKIIKTNNF